MQLERRLHDQVAVRCALEKALGYKSSSQDFNEVTSMPKVPPFALCCLKMNYTICICSILLIQITKFLTLVDILYIRVTSSLKKLILDM